MPAEVENAYKGVPAARNRVRALNVPESNKEAILRFSDSSISEGLSRPRVLKYLSALTVIARRFPKGREFSSATREDIEALVAGIECSSYAEWTKRDFRITLKKFFRWLRQTDEYPPEVRWLRATMRNNRVRLPDELLTQQEVLAMATAALTTRDKALIGMLYDSGCRIGEILGLRMKSVERYQHGFRVTVAGMKGSRRLPLIACAPYLAAWLNEHPRRDDPQASLWVTKDYRAQVPSYNRVCDILRSAARRAGVRKAVNPHNFRHSRATHLAKLLTEAQMKEYFGWVQGSDMASTYVHLSGRDLDHVMLKVNNIHAKEDEKASDDFYPKLCRHCGRQNPPGNKFCGQCSNVLDEKAEQEMVQKGLDRGTADGIMDRMLDVEWFRAAFERRLGDVLRERAASLPAPSPSAHRQEARPVSTAA